MDCIQRCNLESSFELPKTKQCRDIARLCIRDSSLGETKNRNDVIALRMRRYSQSAKCETGVLIQTTNMKRSTPNPVISSKQERIESAFALTR
jgi:hypothetical protein